MGKKPLFCVLTTVLTLSACGYVDTYEEHVYDMEPVYCYRHLGGTECTREPIRADDRRMINYYGPHPTRYDPPDRPDRIEPEAPQKVSHYARDPEPIVSDAPLWEARDDFDDDEVPYSPTGQFINPFVE